MFKVGQIQDLDVQTIDSCGLEVSHPATNVALVADQPLELRKRHADPDGSPVTVGGCIVGLPHGGVPEAVENIQVLRKSIGTWRMSSGSPMEMSMSLSRASPTSVIQVSVGPGIPFPTPAHSRRRAAVRRVTMREQAAAILDQGDVESLQSKLCPFNNGRFESFIELTQAGINRGCTTREVGGNERTQWTG